MIEQVSLELELCDIAHAHARVHALNLPDPQKINWTLFTSSTSDCIHAKEVQLSH